MNRITVVCEDTSQVFFYGETKICAIHAWDEITGIGPGFYSIKRTFRNPTSEPATVHPTIEIETFFKPEFTMIPAVSYNGNQWGSGDEPKGLKRDGQPWVFAYNRVSLPAATFSENGVVSVGLFADENSLVSSCSMEETDSGLRHRLIWPDIEQPLTYIGRDLYGAASTPALVLEPGGSLCVGAYLVITPAAQKNFGWTRAYDLAQGLYCDTELPVAMAADAFWKHRINYIKNTQYVQIRDGVERNQAGETIYQWDAKHKSFDLLEMGILPNGNIKNYFGDPPGAVFKLRDMGFHRFEIGWCGQNGSLAVSLIHDHIRNGCDDSLRIALAVLDTWAEHAPLPCGLFECQFDDILGDPYEIDTCNLGWGTWQFLEAYEALQSIGIDKPAYRKIALDCCDFFINHKAPDGSLGKSWRKDGTCEDPGGTIGCYMLLGFTKAYQLTQAPTYLDAAKAAFRFYVDRDLNAMACTAGALDTHCIDKETCWPLLKAGLDLYALTGETIYLDDARRAAYYILSWTFQYDTQHEPDTDFAEHGYRSYGGTSVSVQHHHLDPWGSLLSYDFYRLYKADGAVKWRNWAVAIWRNSMMGVSDGNMTVHGLTRPASTQSEIFLQTRFLFGADCKPGRMNDWLQSWPGAFKLVTIRRAERDGLSVKEIFEDA
jgi:hypothetical protein